jgi:hypothetical protein
LFQAVLEIRRGASDSITKRQIVEALFWQRRIEKLSTLEIRTMFGTVHSSLRNHAGTTVEAVGEGIPVTWRLIVKALAVEDEPNP